MRSGLTRSTEADTPIPAKSSLTVSATRAKSKSGSPQPNSSAGIAPGSESASGNSSQANRVRTNPGRPPAGATGSKSITPSAVQRPEESRRLLREVVRQQVLEELPGDHRQEVVRVGTGRRHGEVIHGAVDRADCIE